MRTAVGIFTTRSAAQTAAEQLRKMGFGPDRIVMLTPDSPEARAGHVSEAIPTTEGEPPGIGKAIGSVVGGAVGMAAGLPLGAAVATLFVPGVGPVIATGLLGAALLGLGGAAVGDKLENAMTTGLPKDEVFVYEDALRQGRTVVLALADDETQIEPARAGLAQAGAESIDAAREGWWLGLRDVEREHYVAAGRPFEADEPVFRRGFEAALHVDLRGKTYGEAQAALRERCPDEYNEEPFRRGYDRGLAYWRGVEDVRCRDAA